MQRIASSPHDEITLSKPAAGHDGPASLRRPVGRRLRIGVDARCLLRVQPRGEGQTMLRLYRTMLERQPDIELLLFTDHVRQASLELVALLRGARVVTLDPPGTRFDVWFRFSLPWLCMRHDVDILHAFSSGAPAWSTVPVITTVHDMIPVLVNGPENPGHQRFMRRLRPATRPGSRIVCPSSHTRDDIARLLPERADRMRIDVAPWGPTIDTRRIGATHEPGDQAARTPPTLFAFGGSDARKNTATVIEAFCDSAFRRAGGRLRIVGVDGTRTMERYRALAAERNATDAVELHGFVPDAERERLLLDSDALIYASSYEGFGLPVLDAMTLGVPVLASDRSCIPEVGGTAAVYFDPSDRSSMIAAIDSVLLRPACLRLMREAGFEQAASFTWARCADTYMHIIREMINA